MVAQRNRWIWILLASFLIFGCDSTQTVDLEVEVTARVGDSPAVQAKVLIDGNEVGTTNENGVFIQQIKRQPGAEVLVGVKMEEDGYRAEPWEKSFVTKLPKEGSVERYRLQADLEAVRYVTFTVSDSGQPVEGARISVHGKSAGKTNANGLLEFEYRQLPSKGVTLTASKPGYNDWTKRVVVKPGSRYEIIMTGKKLAPVQKETVAVAAPPPPKAEAPAPKTVAPAPKRSVKSATLSITTLTESYGVTKAIPGVVIRMNGKKIGTTNRKGAFAYTYAGPPVDSATLGFTAAGYVPETRETEVSLNGNRSLKLYFYPAVPAPIRVGMYGFRNNSPQTDLSDVIERAEEAIANNLFVFTSFKRVSKENIRKVMQKARLDLETISTKGWRKTALMGTVDMIVAGSISEESGEYLIETTVMTSNGNTILSQINRAKKKENIKNTAKLIVNGIIDQFPFEGTITEVGETGYRINLGTFDYRIRRGNQFHYLPAGADRSGKGGAAREAGLLRVVDTEDAWSLAEAVELVSGVEIETGDRVIRRIYLDEKKETEQASAVVVAKGGIFPDEKPLWGVNVYLENSWVGTTDAGGKVEIPLSLYEEHDILLSRHGYRQVQETISVDRKGGVKEFFLEQASALFRVESEPSGAEVFVDGVNIGKTPIREGKLINFGFRKIKLSAGGEYRDWEQIIEVSENELDRTGENKIVFMKDYIKVGRMAEQKGDTDGAIKAYEMVEKSNPDYSAARTRLAQLYMDEKSDYEGAIREFENVLSLPENRQIIYKQYAVAYTNLGHAYYEKGNQLIRLDRRKAAQNFASAIERLNVAKQNTRFFPSKSYNEAIHDTYYYSALSYHKLYLVTKKQALVDKADLAWREYFDFYPEELNGKGSFDRMRSSAEKYWNQIKDLR